MEILTRGRWRGSIGNNNSQFTLLRFFIRTDFLPKYEPRPKISGPPGREQNGCKTSTSIRPVYTFIQRQQVMDKPHKVHHKASSGAKAAKKDAARGVDRSGGQGYNPKVRLMSSIARSLLWRNSWVAKHHIDNLLMCRPSSAPRSGPPIALSDAQPTRTSSGCMSRLSIVIRKNAR